MAIGPKSHGKSPARRLPNGKPSPNLFQAEGPWQEAREGEFEMMDVSVTVLGLTGVMSEAVKTKKGRKSCGAGGGPGSSRAPSGHRRSGSRSRTIGASSSSGDSSDTDHIPVTAVASFFKNVTSYKTSIGTHLPSLALGTPTSSFGNTSRYMASWPSPFDAQSRGTYTSRGMANGNASFKFSRVMKRHVVDGSWDGEDPSVIDGGGNGVFTPETMDVLVGLSRGSDMIPLGVATLVITGEEVGEVQVNLPVKTGNAALASMSTVNTKNAKGKNAKGNKKQKIFKTLAKGAKNSKKGAFFKVAPGSRYRLDETAALRLLVKAVPRNGGYDHDGSVVSALSCPTGSSNGSSSDSSGSSSESEDDDYDEPSAVMSRPSQTSQQNSAPSHPSRGAHHESGIPLAPPAKPKAHGMPMNNPPSSRQDIYPNMPSRSPHRHQQSQSPQMMQQQHQLQQYQLSQQRSPYGGRAPHPHFAIQPITSEASTEPGYGDEFEGILTNQENVMDECRGPSPRRTAGKMSPIPIDGKTLSGGSRETAMTTPATSDDSSVFMMRARPSSCEPCTSIFSCGAMSSLCLVDNGAEPLSSTRKKKKPPMKNIFTNGAKDKRGKSRKSRHYDYDSGTADDTVEDTVDDTAEEPTIASESSHSMGSNTYQDMEATREKLRAYANRMGLDPAQLL